MARLLQNPWPKLKTSSQFLNPELLYQQCKIRITRKSKSKSSPPKPSKCSTIWTIMMTISKSLEPVSRMTSLMLMNSSTFQVIRTREKPSKRARPLQPSRRKNQPRRWKRVVRIGAMSGTRALRARILTISTTKSQI